MSVDDHLEYRHLKYIIAVAETGSMSAAAARLHVAQSAISEQICAIEEILEARIFERSSGGCTLTAEGRVLLTFAYAAVEDRKHIIQTVQAIHVGRLMPLRLGFTSFVHHALLKSVAELYKELLPESDFIPESGDTDELTNRIRQDSLDAALVTLPIMDDGLKIIVLERERLVVLMRADDPVAESEAVPPGALDGKISVFTYQRNHPTAYARLVEMFEELGVRLRPAKPTLNIDHIQWMVREGVCYSLIRASRPLINGLVTRRIAGVDWTIDSALISKTGKQHPALPLLIRELTKRFPAELEILPKKLPMAARFRETAKHDTDDQMALFAADNAPDQGHEREGHRSNLYRHRK